MSFFLANEANEANEARQTDRQSKTGISQLVFKGTMARMDRKTDRQTDRQTDIQTGRQTKIYDLNLRNKQTNKH